MAQGNWPELPKGWVTYNGWNHAVCAGIFDGRHAGRPAYLDVDEETFGEIADLNGELRHESSPGIVLAGALAETLNLPHDKRNGVFERHTTQARFWRLGRDKHDPFESTPPFLALLAFAVAVAEEMCADETFAAHNYYGRMTRLLNEALGREYSKSKVEQSYRDHVHPCWGDLNQWLIDAQGLLGIPTVQTSSPGYVRIPISQALLRSSDHPHIETFFLRFIGEPREVAFEEMEFLLSRWVKTAPISRSIKKVWSSSDRAHVVELMLAEFKGWEGADSGEEAKTGLRVGRLLLQAVLRTRPRRQIVLTATVRDRAGLPEGPYRETVSEDGRATLHAGVEHVRLEPSLYGSSFRHVEPGDAWSVPNLLARASMLIAETEDLTLRRDPKGLVVLRLHPDGMVFIEQERAEIGARHLVLCTEKFVDDLQRLLGRSARPGWELIGATELPGLPNGWSAFTDVEIVDTFGIGPEDIKNFGAVLPEPILQVRPSGGLTLPGRVIGTVDYHVARPPTLLVAGGPPNKTLTLRAAAGEGGETLLTEAVRSPSSVLMNHRALPGEVVLTIHDESNDALATRRLWFAEALLPPRRGRGRPYVGFAIEDGRLRSIVSEEESALVVRGAILDAQPTEPDHEGSATPAGALAPGMAEDETSSNGASAADFDDVPQCLLRPTAHHWLMDNGRAFVSSVCRDCGAHAWLSNFIVPKDDPTKKAKAAAGPSVAEATSTAAPMRLSEVEEERDPDWSLLLDALSLLGGGTWSALSSLARQLTLEPTGEVAQMLAALGHIEADLNPGARPTRWSVAPPALVVLPGGTSAVLAGFRSSMLVDALHTAAKKAGASVDVSEAPEQRPAIIRLHFDNGQIISKVTSEVEQATGIMVAVARDVPATLLGLSPRLADALATLPTTPYIGGKYEETFDLSAMKWLQGGALKPGTAVRFGRFPRTYAFVERGGVDLVLRAGDYRTVKHLAAAATGKPLVSFAEKKEELCVPLGAQLPGLLERAVVLCSGVPPTPMDDGTVRYHGVPGPIAATVWSRLRGWTSDQKGG